MSIMREPIVGGRLLPDGGRMFILGWDIFSPEQEERFRTESAIMQAKIMCVEQGLLTGDELSNYDWTVSEQPMTPEDLAAFARDSQTTMSPGLGPCRRCGRPTIRAEEGAVRHMDPSGRPSWRTCRAASKEWIPQKFGVRGPTRDETLDPHWAAQPPAQPTITRIPAIEPQSEGEPTFGGKQASSVGPKMMIVVTRTPLAARLLSGQPSPNGYVQHGRKSSHLGSKDRPPATELCAGTPATALASMGDTGRVIGRSTIAL